VAQQKTIQIHQQTRWQTALAKAISEPAELIRALDLDPSFVEQAQLSHQQFKLRVPLSYVQKIEKGNPNDPLLKQILPISEELKITPGYSKDPLAEQQANKVPGLLHKYPSRILLTVTSACAINCRYCFRRHFAYDDNKLSKTNIEQVLNYLTQHPEINEVIYSGGDPLIASDDYLANLSQQITAIPSIKRLRIHSRMAITLPERITAELCNWLSALPVPAILVTHCNHPNELDQETINNMQRLKEAGVTLLNQTVLLKGVNDNADTLTALSEKLFASNILPYYLHLLDKVEGAAHFDLPLEKAKRLYSELQRRLPGFLVPKLARETPGKLHKDY
jgi:EF-P beta-lysylation protein EpmB